MLKLKLQYSGYLMQRTDLLEKTLMLGKTEGRRRREQRMSWLDGIYRYEFEQTPRVGDGQGSLSAVIHGVAKSQTWVSDRTEWECKISMLMFLLFYDQKNLFILRIFNVGQFLKSLLNLLQYCFCFMVCFFGHETCGILTASSWIELAPLHWKVKFLTPGVPGKSFLSCKVIWADWLIM